MHSISSYQMKIQSLHLNNFRCYQDLTIKFHEKLNVIVGNNGAGKTTILDGVVSGLHSFHTNLTGVYSSPISFTKDIRRNAVGGYEAKGSIQLETYDQSKYQLDLTPQLQSDEEKQAIGSIINAPQNIVEIKKKLNSNPQEKIILPIYAYYRSTRNIAKLEPVNPKPNDRLNRLDALQSAQDAFAHYQQVTNWLYHKDMEEAREIRDRNDLGYRNAEKQQVINAVKRMLKPVSNVTFTKKSPYRLILKWRKPNGDIEDRLVSQLSDGYRNMLALVMDFARRLTQANPHLDNPLDQDSLLLIDEIDLHLHPEWQQTVLIDLQRTFPNTQIICTTHSPQVLTTVKPENILILNDGNIETASGEYSYGVESHRVLENILEVPASPELQEIERAKEKLMNALDAFEIDSEQIETEIKALANDIGHDAPFLVNVRASLARLRKK